MIDMQKLESHRCRANINIEDREEGRVTSDRKKVAICGSHPKFLSEVPRLSEEWEIWGLNDIWNLGIASDYCKDGYEMGKGYFWRADRWFELHILKAQTQRELKAMIDFNKCPLYVFDEPDNMRFKQCFDLNKMWVKYPLKKIAKMIPGGDYLTNSFAMMIALAIYEGFTEIALHGISMDDGRELVVEKPCLEYWVGVARGKGIKVWTPPMSSTTRHPYIYGLHYFRERKWVQQKLSEAIPGICQQAYCSWTVEESV